MCVRVEVEVEGTFWDLGSGSRRLKPLYYYFAVLENYSDSDGFGTQEINK
jgi:hypothetical protein